MGKLLLKKHRHLLYIINKDKKKFIRFNIKDKCLEKKNYNYYWEEVKTQYDFFKGFGINDLECDDCKFLNLIELSMTYNAQCSSLSTFIVRISECLVYENFIDQGVKFRPHRTWDGKFNHLKYHLNDYCKIVIKVLKNSRFEVTPDFERIYFDNEGTMFKFMNILNTLNLNPERQCELIEAVTNRMDDYKALTTTFKYDTKSLLNFLANYLDPFENIRFQDGIELLHSYYSMSIRIGRKVKKYPKYLRSMHDIIRANFNAYKREYDELKFSRLQKPELEYNDKDFCIITPKNSKDIIAEGTQLNHCVSSYVDNIIAEVTLIIFLRRSKMPEESLVTLEYKDRKIIQAKGSYNRDLTCEELEFLKKFCDKKNIQLALGRGC